MKSSDNMDSYSNIHLKFGWCVLFIFVLIGLTLESLHGFKVNWYLDISNETRRLLFTLAHAHGALLAIINIVFALSLQRLPGVERHIKLVSICLILSSILLPSGFLLGGLAINGSDPGVGIVFAVLGAIILVFTIGLIALSTIKKES